MKHSLQHEFECDIRDDCDLNPCKFTDERCDGFHFSDALKVLHDSLHCFSYPLREPKPLRGEPVQ